MNLALKSIGRISELLGASPISQSTLWNKEVDAITPQIIVTFIVQQTIEGRRDLAESAIHIAQREVREAFLNNPEQVKQFLSYTRHTRTVMTLGELKKGLAYLGSPRSYAVLFGLEMDLDAVGVAMLTHSAMRKLELTKLAEDCANEMPRQLMLQYVFWHKDEYERVTPVFGLDAAVFDAFGLLWDELKDGYKNLIIDGDDVDKQAINQLFS